MNGLRVTLLPINPALTKRFEDSNKSTNIQFYQKQESSWSLLLGSSYLQAVIFFHLSKFSTILFLLIWASCSYLFVIEIRSVEFMIAVSGF